MNWKQVKCVSALRYCFKDRVSFNLYFIYMFYVNYGSLRSLNPILRRNNLHFAYLAAIIIFLIADERSAKK